MTKPIKTIMVALLAIMITSCAMYRNAMDSGKKVNLSALKIGMTRTEVQTALNKRPDNVVAAKNYPQTNTLVEVVQYTQWGQTNSIQSGQTNGGNANAPVVSQGVSIPLQSYWLYFVNDKLDKWEIAVPDRSPRI